jgi:hypothetical protein
MSGLWDQTISRDGSDAHVAHIGVCVDETLESKTSVFSHADARGASDHCRDSSVQRGPDGGYIFASNCDLGSGGTVVTKGIATGDFAAGYHARVETDVTGAAYDRLNGHHVTEITARRIGACPTGMAAGDVRLANGMTVNPGKLRAAAAAFGLQ